MTLRRQMILLIAVPTLVIYVVILGLAMGYAYRQAKEARQREMTQLALSYASRFDGQLREVAQIAETTAGFMETAGPLPDEKVYKQLERDVAQSPLVYGACMAFEPGTVKPAGELFAPYACRNANGGSGFRRLNIDQSVYDWYRDPSYTWYQQPKQLGHGVWSEPYFDEGAGNILMATYSATFRLNGKFGGVSTVDIDLPRLHQTVGRDFKQELNFVILARDGRFVYDPNVSRILAKSIFDVAREQNRPALADLGKRMLAGGAGVGVIDGWDGARREWVFFAPIESTQWVFASRFPEAVILADVRRQALWLGAALGATLLLIVTCIAVASRRVTAPITRLTQSVIEVGQGNLEAEIDQSGRTDELRGLSSSFKRMTGELRSHIDRLATEQAARARIEHDLAIAREIQQSLLPAGDPTSDGLDIAGRSRYCDETGGDYYDFIEAVDPSSGTMLIAVGDVIGHGIAAAVLMASARAGLRVQAAADARAGALSQMLNKVNHLLTADNRHARFMTMALLAIEPGLERVRWASAGHDPVIVFHPDDDSFEELEGGGLPLGIDANEQYEEFQCSTLRRGDILVLGTDGIWEMMDPAGEMFGKDRLRELIRQCRDCPVGDIASAIERSLEEFRGGAHPKDDVTFVLIRLNGIAANATETAAAAPSASAGQPRV